MFLKAGIVDCFGASVLVVFYQRWNRPSVRPIDSSTVSELALRGPNLTAASFIPPGGLCPDRERHVICPRIADEGLEGRSR